MPSFASTSGPARKVDIPIKNKRYQLPRYPFTEPMAEGTAPEPGSGMLVPWTRVSTLLDTHKDKEGILKWKNRLTAKGLSEREDLIALGAAARLSDKSTLDRVCEQAFDYAKGQASANIGQALHGFLERWLEGDKTLHIPEQWRPDVAAVTAAFQDAGITPVPELQEIVVVRPDLADGDSAGLAGRLDLVVWYEGQLTIADYKTGSDPLLYGAWEIQQQGGIYGSAWAMWDGEFWRPMPPIRRDKMLMIHVLPGAATVTISEIDLDSAELEADIASAYRTRRRRKEAKKAHRLVLQVEDGAVDAPLDTAVVEPTPIGTPEGNAIVFGTASFRSTPGHPTPDAALQAQKAAERLAKVDALAKASGRNDDPDDAKPLSYAEGAPEITGASVVGAQIAATILNGEGKPLTPVVAPGSGKKGCSVCGRAGHRKGGKACLGTADPRFETRVVPGTDRDISLDEHMAGLAASHPGGVFPDDPPVHPAGGHSWTRDPITGDWSCAVGGEPAAPEVAAVLTDQQERPGQTSEPVQDFPGQVTKAELVNDSIMLPGADGPVEPDPFDDDGSQVLSAKEQDWHLFLDRINGAKDKAEIRAIRAEATELGVWDDQLLQAGLARIKTF